MRTLEQFSFQTWDARRGSRLGRIAARRGAAAYAVAVCAMGLPLAGAFLSGCGSDHGTTNFVQSGGGANFGSRSYTANPVTLRGSEALTGKTAILALTTDASGGASGTLSINDPTHKAGASAAVTRLVIATPAVNGTYDPQSGALSVSGTFTLNGVAYPFDISGTLPPAGGAGNLTYNIAGETYSTSFVVPAGGGGGTTTGGTTGGQSQNGAFAGTINNNGGANVAGGSVNIASVAGGSYTSSNGALSVGFLQAQGAGSQNLSITGLGGVAVGTEVAVNDNTAIIQYSETKVNTSTFATEVKIFLASGGGTIKVLSASGGVIKVQLTNVVMKANTDASTSAGSFLLSGTATVTGATTQ